MKIRTTGKLTMRRRLSESFVVVVRTLSLVVCLSVAVESGFFSIVCLLSVSCLFFVFLESFFSFGNGAGGPG